nr:spore cortex biosynthesis protein YabQ [Vulcanibacillus modesticaldus]
MLSGGFLLGTLFDGYRVLIDKIKLPRLLIFFLDIIFGISSAIIIFLALLWSNHGQIRLVILFAFFLGLWIYFISFSKIIVELWLLAYNFLYHGIIEIIKVIDLVIIKPIIVVYHFILLIVASLIKMALSLGMFISYPFLILYKWIYKNIRKIAIKGKKLIKKEEFLSLLKKLFRL